MYMSEKVKQYIVVPGTHLISLTIALSFKMCMYSMQTLSPKTYNNGAINHSRYPSVLISNEAFNILNPHSILFVFSGIFLLLINSVYYFSIKILIVLCVYFLSK